jgi:hypothetical protein
MSERLSKLKSRTTDKKSGNLAEEYDAEEHKQTYGKGKGARGSLEDVEVSQYAGTTMAGSTAKMNKY